MEFQRRVPLPLSSVPTETDDPVQRHLNEICYREQKTFIMTGALTPRRRDMTTDAPSNHRNMADESPKPRTNVPFLSLHRLFAVLTEAGDDPICFPSLRLLGSVAGEKNPMAIWRRETDLDRKIRRRHEEFDAAISKRRARALELMKEQQREESESERFHRLLCESRKASEYSAAADRMRVSEIDQQAERADRQNQMRQEERKLLGVERKRRMQEEFARRKQEREERIKSLLDIEEDLRDQLDAVKRVRGQLELERRTGSSPSPRK